MLYPQLFASAVATGQASLNEAATAVSANDNAQALINPGTALGISASGSGTGLITVGAAGSVVGRSTGVLGAVASSTNGGSDANASLAQAIGIAQAGGESIQIGSVGSVLGTVDLNQLARSTSVAADANASAITELVSGLTFNAAGGTISTGSDGSVQGLALINTSASATTVGNDATADAATAVQRLGTAIGTDLTTTGTHSGAATIAIGGVAEVVGAAIANGSATATATAGDSSATAGLSDGPGSVTTLTGLRTVASEPAVAVGGAGSINGNASGDFRAIASSVVGAADAIVDGSAMAVGGGGQISLGDAARYNAATSLTSLAQASSTNGDANAQVAPYAQSVIGTALYGAASSAGAGTGVGLSIGGNGRINSTATARQLGSSATTNGSATTSFGSSAILGFDSSDTAVQGDLNGYNAAASLLANGNASALLGAASVEALNGYSTIGVINSQLAVAGEATAALTTSGTADVRFTAQSTNGDASALLNNAVVKGIDDSFGLGQPEIQIGGDAARVAADARQSVRLSASSVNGNNATSIADGLLAAGTQSIGVDIGGGGVLSVTATNLVDLAANNVGSASSDGRAIARIGTGEFLTEAVKDSQGIHIGQNGLVEANAVAAGSLTAKSVNGNAEASLDAETRFLVSGLATEQLNSFVSIGSNGDVRATASLQGATGSADPFLVQANSTAGSANARFGKTAAMSADRMSIQAIATFHDGSLITAGAAAGNLTADAKGHVELMANSTAGAANASFGAISGLDALPFDVTAIESSDIRAGFSGRNRVGANAELNLVSSAKSVGSNAVSDGRATVRGITDQRPDIDGGNSIQLAGDIDAVARFSNTALARTVQGQAVSSARNDDVIGVNRYALSLIGSGSLAGAAHGAMIARSNSIDGAATATAQT